MHACAARLLDREPLTQVGAHIVQQRRETAIGAPRARAAPRTATARPAGGGRPPSCCATLRATSSPRSSAMSASDRSMPAVMPAELQTSPLHEDAIGVELHPRILPREVLAAGPVRGGGAPSSRPAGGEDVGARTDARTRRTSASGAPRISPMRCSLSVRVPSPPETMSVSMLWAGIDTASCGRRKSSPPRPRRFASTRSP